MDNFQKHAKAWKFLQDKVAKIQDPTLRNTMMAAFRQRALAEWGYCPDDGLLAKNTTAPQLDAWEQEFVQDIDDAVMWQIDTRDKKRTQTLNEARAHMMDFVRHGGMLSEIPDYIRCDVIDNLYYDCLESIHRDTIAAADNFIQNCQNNTKTDDDLIQNSD